jgi:hypothetical protein
MLPSIPFSCERTQFIWAIVKDEAKRISENEDKFNEWIKRCKTQQRFRDLLNM